MDRRVFLGTLAGGLLAAPIAIEAQQVGKVYRIGILRAGGRPPEDWVDAFRHGLGELGYVDGQTIAIEIPDTAGGADLLQTGVERLVRSKVDVIVAVGAPPSLAAKQATTSVPIVMVITYDPVEQGLVRSLGRPGGNITGLATGSAELFGKRLELLKELVPKLRRVAVLWDRGNPANALQFRGAQIAARTLGMQLVPTLVRDPNDFEAAFQAVHGVDGLLVLDRALFTNLRARLAALATKTGLPSMYGFKEMADVGGLMAYGLNFVDAFRRATIFVDKIIKGARPADLPVEQPTKFEFVISLKTAKVLGLTIPPSLLARADQVIE